MPTVVRTYPALELAKSLIRLYPGRIVSTVLTAYIISWSINNYRKFHALGHSGLGRGLFGWLISTTATLLVGRETTSTTEYDHDPNKESYLVNPDSIPERRGARPHTGWHCFPHRQVDRWATPEYTDRLSALFYKMAKENSHLVDVELSPHEMTIDSMVITSSIPSPHQTAVNTLREIAHVHEIDHSVHVVLSPQDCKIIIERGWGERHPLSGSSRLVPLPKEYIFMYVPRNEEELEVMQTVIAASIGFMTSSRDVKI